MEEKEDHVDPGVPVRSVPELATFPRLLMSVHVRTRLVNVLVIKGRRAAASVVAIEARRAAPGVPVRLVPKVVTFPRLLMSAHVRADSTMYL